MASDFPLDLGSVNNSNADPSKIPDLVPGTLSPQEKKAVPQLKKIDNATQLGTIQLLNLGIKIPAKTIHTWESITDHPLRIGCNNSDITRFDPASPEFDKSIDWNSSIFPNTGKLHKSSSDLTTASISDIELETCSYLLKEKINTVVGTNHFSYRQLPEIASAEKNWLALKAQLCKVPERNVLNWEVYANTSKRVLNSFLYANLFGWITNSNLRVPIVSRNRSNFYSCSGSPLATDPNRKKYQRNRLINVFENYSGSPYVCLTFLQVTLELEGNGAVSRNPIPSLTKISNFWIRLDSNSSSLVGSISDSTPISVSDSLIPAPYATHGLVNLAYSLYIHSVGLRLDNHGRIYLPISFENKEGKVFLDVEESRYLGETSYSPHPFATWGTHSSYHFFDYSPFFFIPEHIGLKKEGTNLVIDKDSPLSNITKIKAIQELTLEQCRRIGVPRFTTPGVIGFQAAKERNIQSMMTRSSFKRKIDQAFMAAKIDAIKTKYGKLGDDLSYSEISKLLCEPEFKANLFL